MASRPVISYDDITLPYEPSSHQPQPQPPQKKRKRNHHHNNQQKRVQQQQQLQHWDDPNPVIRTKEEEEEAEEEEEEDYDETESRELTHEEIWDDSALVDAWNAAMEEYEAYHGPDKGWKKQPVHKSPLWYNIPPKKTKPKKSVLAVGPRLPSTDELDSQPLDFESFVPTHDPGLSGAINGEEEEGKANPVPALDNISQDEAFERAVQASYWSGYWTAVYHYRRQNQPNVADAEEEEGEMQDFTSTQR